MTDCSASTAARLEPLTEVRESALVSQDQFRQGERVWFYETRKWPHQQVRSGVVLRQAGEKYVLEDDVGELRHVHNTRLFNNMEKAVATAVRFELEMKHIVDQGLDASPFDESGSEESNLESE